MTVTYDDALTTDRDKVRFYLQDTVEDSGPKPSDGNFSNEELDGLITAEGSWQKAVAAGLEILSNAWATYADYQAGPRRESLSQIARQYAEQANKWRERHGPSGSTGAAGVKHVTRIDGYSSDVASDAV